jgi:phosphomethylpyrimidine synthase
MNKPVSPSDLLTPKVTTGPVRGSRKIYVGVEGASDLRIPFREIALAETSGEAPFRVYDSSGPYTDAAAVIDVEKGLPRIRDAWVKDRGGVEAYDGRVVKPEDNGNVSGAHAARVFPTVHRPLRATSPSPLRGGWRVASAASKRDGWGCPT